MYFLLILVPFSSEDKMSYFAYLYHTQSKCFCKEKHFCHSLLLSLLSSHWIHTEFPWKSSGSLSVSDKYIRQLYWFCTVQNLISFAIMWFCFLLQRQGEWQVFCVFLKTYDYQFSHISKGYWVVNEATERKVRVKCHVTFFLTFLYFRLCILVHFFHMWYFYAFWSEDCSLMGQWMEFVTCSPLRYVLNFCLQGVKVSVAVWPFMNVLIWTCCLHKTFGCFSVCLNCKIVLYLSGTIPSPKVQRL